MSSPALDVALAYCKAWSNKNLDWLTCYQKAPWDAPPDGSFVRLGARRGRAALELD